MLNIDYNLKAEDLKQKIKDFWVLSGKKIIDLDKHYDVTQGSPVYTVKGKYTTRGWTEWTQGFQFGSAILQYDATGELEFLNAGKNKTMEDRKSVV